MKFKKWYTYKEGYNYGMKLQKQLYKLWIILKLFQETPYNFEVDKN